MLGMYGDTRESMQRTISFAIKLAPDIANFAVSAPYPGTEWNRIASERGWIQRDQVWESFDQNYAAIVEHPDCSSSLVKKMQREAYLRWYLSWRGIKLLLTNPGSIGFFLHVASDHINSIFKKTA